MRAMPAGKAMKVRTTGSNRLTKTVMLPKRNQRDLEEIPEDARQRLTFVWLETVADAAATAIAPAQ